jgi:hypothetical protein
MNGLTAWVESALLGGVDSVDVESLEYDSADEADEGNG